MQRWAWEDAGFSVAMPFASCQRGGTLTGAAGQYL